MVHTQLYSGSFPENINDLRSPSNYPFVGMLYDDSSLLYSYKSRIKQNDDEILYKAPLIQDVEYVNNGVDTSIHINTLELTPTDTDYNILQFNYSNSNDKVLSGRFDAGNGGHEFYCLQSDAITELVLPNGIEEIDALALYCPNLTTVTLPSSIKRFRSVTYDNPWTEEGDVTKTLIFGSKIETIYFDGTMNEWRAIDKNANWIPIGKRVRINCHDYWLIVNNIPSVDITEEEVYPQPIKPGGSIEK